MSLTEFYNLIELNTERKFGRSDLQEESCELMDVWSPQEQHERIISFCKSNDIPILTTNFEHTLEEAGGCEKRKNNIKGFTDFYPWETYFSTKKSERPIK
jgi:hypothetical protein